MSRRLWIILVIAGAVVLLLTACGGSGGGAVSAVETYLNALVAKDANQMIAVSCADWEASARRELDSFAAVEAELRDLSCAESGTDGEYTVVACTGIISATYNNEARDLDLSARPFLTALEGGDWRVCGYQE
jgi:hypothetical protein